jgi:ferric-dicitrate binding protein FerR (iron transport regulator)
MGQERIQYLLKRYADNEASEEEVEEMMALLHTSGGEEALKEKVVEIWNEREERTVSEEDWNRMWSSIHQHMQAERQQVLIDQRLGVKPMRRFGVWGRVAAALLLILGAGAAYWKLTGRKRNEAPVAVRTVKRDIAPGGNKAVLTLANGATIVLDNAHDGVLAQQGGTNVLKLDAGSLAYNTGGKDNEGMMYNTIATPNGGQYQVTLPDGSKVWLNAASSLKFPTRFEGKERSVELTGEAYFEVAQRSNMPFRVKVHGNGGNGMDVQVLGTAFDVMAYADEKTSNTTLVSGKVNVVSNGAVRVLAPGKQSILDNQTRDLRVEDANVEQVVAWKNGLFRFRETGIRDLMRQVQRWYNVQVVYEAEGKDQDFTGVVARNQPVSALLQMLEMTGTVHFRIEDKKIIVLP